MVASLGQSLGRTEFAGLQAMLHSARRLADEEAAAEATKLGKARYFGLLATLKVLATKSPNTSMRNDAYFTYFLVRFLPAKSAWGTEIGGILAMSNSKIAAKFNSVHNELHKALGLEVKATGKPLAPERVTDRLTKLRDRGWLTRHRLSGNHARFWRCLDGDAAPASRGYCFHGLLSQQEALGREAIEVSRRIRQLEQRRAALLDQSDSLDVPEDLQSGLQLVRRRLLRMTLTASDAAARLDREEQELERLQGGAVEALPPSLPPRSDDGPKPSDSKDETTRFCPPQYKESNPRESSCSSGGAVRGGRGREWPSSPSGVGAAEWLAADLQRSGFMPQEGTLLFPVLQLWTDRVGSWLELERLAWLAARSGGISDRLVTRRSRPRGRRLCPSWFASLFSECLTNN